jgi:hypothetical protein
MITHQVAQTIAQQLGGNKFVAMTGATLVGSADSLTICLGRSKAVIIKLEADDTYTVTLHKAGRFTRKGDYIQGQTVARPDIYCDMLQATFTDLTGLLTHL